MSCRKPLLLLLLLICNEACFMTLRIPDEAMVRRFTEHRPSLEQLVQMAIDDRLDCIVDLTQSFGNCQGRERLEKYRILLSGSSIALLPHARERRIDFTVEEEPARWIKSSIARDRGFSYSLNGDLTPLTANTAVSEPEVLGCRFKHIDGPWYLFSC